MRNNGSALLQRNTARLVRQTASLVSGHDRIRERQGELWAADCKNRIIYWRVNHPYKPLEVLSDDQILWLTIHEATHLLMSGSWNIPDPPVIDDKERFFRFWNAVEDIRIEHWAMNRFPGKAHACKDMRLDFHAALGEFYDDINNTGMHIADQVGLNFINLAYDIPIYGDKKSQKFTLEHWPEIEKIAFTSRSSQQVADRILPIYQKLMKDMPPDQPKSEPQDGDITLEFDGEGFLSTDKDGNPGRVLSFEELLEGMARDAKGDTKRRIQVKIKDEKTARELAKRLAASGIGEEASHIEGYSNHWEMTKQYKRGPINVLTRRLQTVLSHNEASAYEERLKRGQFNSGHAHRSLQGDMRVFRKKHAIGRADYDFVITVDMSGSQSGREEQLLASCVVASEAIEQSGMGLSIITWDGEMRHWKNWYSSIKSCQGIIGNDLANAGGGTYEGYALRVAEELIRHRLNMGRSVFLITLTDGQTLARDESVAIMADLELHGVKSIGVGVMCSPPDHYSTKISVETGEELANVLPNLLRTLIKRG